MRRFTDHNAYLRGDRRRAIVDLHAEGWSNTAISLHS